jgi:hypothetical protein
MESSIGVYHRICHTIGPSDDLYIIGAEKVFYDGTTRTSYFNGSSFGCKYLARVYSREEVDNVLKELNKWRYIAYGKKTVEKLLPMSR